MRLSIRNALLIAGVTLLASFVAAQFQNGKLLFATLLVLLAPVVLFLSFKKEVSRHDKGSHLNKRTAPVQYEFLGLP